MYTHTHTHTHTHLVWPNLVLGLCFDSSNQLSPWLWRPAVLCDGCVAIQHIILIISLSMYVCIPIPITSAGHVTARLYMRHHLGRIPRAFNRGVTYTCGTVLVEFHVPLIVASLGNPYSQLATYVATFLNHTCTCTCTCTYTCTCMWPWLCPAQSARRYGYGYGIRHARPCVLSILDWALYV